VSEQKTHTHQHQAAAPAEEKKLDLRERGGARNGQPQLLDKRLFMQLIAFGDCRDGKGIGEVLEKEKISGAVYLDANDPRGIGVLTMTENPDELFRFHSVLNRAPFDKLTLKPEYSMLGRTYAIGYEPDLEDTLLKRPRRVTLDKGWPWAVWYPLRRTGAFSQLSHQEQGQILKEHGNIGRQFGEADLAKDIRLACTGIDKNDNDFVIGLVGKELFPLSALVQTMRPTQQTSKYIQHMGPFFVGRAVWQSPL
jgi:chlorite dismutase